jgi:hypothetical protein
MFSISTHEEKYVLIYIKKLMPNQGVAAATPCPLGSSASGYVHSPWLVPSLGEVPRYRITITFIIFTYF